MQHLFAEVYFKLKIPVRFLNQGYLYFFLDYSILIAVLHFKDLQTIFFLLLFFSVKFVINS